MTLLHTSPLLFLRPGGRSTVAGRQLDYRLSLAEIEMLSFFAEPADFEKAVQFGFDKEQIGGAVKHGLLVECDDTGNGAGSTWEDYNLQRAANYMFSDFQSQSHSADLSFKAHLNQSKEGLAASLSTLLNRRTERFFTDEAVPLEVLAEIAADVNNAIGENSWLSFRILVQGVDGIEPGVYALEPKTGACTSCVENHTRKDLLECLHGQWWLNGGGVCWFFVVSLSELAKHEKSNPRSYFEMIALLGSIGQALVSSVYKHGLGCWMTPALSETLSAQILGLSPNDEEALYFFKVGIPERALAATGEKRSPI